jgi:SAM-dependent methyltransferase
MAATDRLFAGAIPTVYETHMVPLIFADYAVDLAARVVARSPGSVLELAAGTGVLTRALIDRLPSWVSVLATDLNPAMLAQAQAVGTKRAVTWRQADAMALPFPDGSFDAVTCQFGVMFLPDKARGYAEVHRVLSPGGVFVFNTWDRIEDNELADAALAGLAKVFPEDPPRFIARIPHGYFDTASIARDLARGGFTGAPKIETIALRSKAASARVAAIAFCQGTPLRNEIEARDPARLDAATAAVAEAIAARFAGGALDAPVEAKMQAHIVTVAG